MATVYLVDASPYVFRAYYSLPTSMTCPAGKPVNGVYGFAGFLAKLIGDEEPSHLAVTFDESLNSSFRNEIYPAYKAQRELPPPELEAQLKDCQELAHAFGAATFVDSRYEADDLIGTLSHGLSRDGHEVVIVTSDKDLAQLVTEKVSLYDFARGERYGPEEVREKFGVSPEQIPDYLGLAGDSVDNIPGVAGIGPKTAAALLSHFEDLDTLYARLDEVLELPIRGARSVYAKLEKSRDIALLSRRLATITDEAPARFDLESLRLEGARPEAVDPLFARLGFENLRQRIPRWES